LNNLVDTNLDFLFERDNLAHLLDYQSCMHLLDQGILNRASKIEQSESQANFGFIFQILTMASRNSYFQKINEFGI